MRQKKIIWVVFGSVIFSALLLRADYDLELKMRFYEGVREGKSESPEFVTSSYLQPTVTATIPARFLLAEEREQIGKVFNLKTVNLITEADLRWSAKKGDIAHIFRLDGKEYRMTLSVVPNEFKMSSDPTKKGAVYQIKIGILEQHREKKINLLDTEIILPHQKNVVLGFENREGTPYFLSFHVVKPPPPPPPPPAPPPAPPSPPSPPPPPPKDIQQIKEEIREFERGAVRCVGEIEPPKLIKKVEPVYPEDAKKAKVSGVVILGVRTDTQGHVKNAMVYKSKDPLLVQPSIDAVKQWEYEPLYVKGEPVDAVFTVTVTFKLEEEAMVGGVVGGVIELKDLEKPPKLIKKVDPVYPEEAKKQGIQGVVVIEATTDEQGNVIKGKILKSESSLLNQSAVDALKQWKYEPVYKEGKPVGITFTVTITFKLK
jgi:TonB family protein